MGGFRVKMHESRLLLINICFYKVKHFSLGMEEGKGWLLAI